MNKAKKNNGDVKFVLDLGAYPLKAIYQACYVFLDRAYIFIDSPSSRTVQVFLKGKKRLSQKQFKNLRGEFLNELLNSALRLEIAKRNRKIREAIIGQALISALGEGVSFKDDPLGIAVPWEEKYGKKEKKS